MIAAAAAAPVYALNRTVEPATMPITTAQAKSWSRIEISDDDADIDRMIADATDFVERWCDLQCVRATYTLTMPRFPQACGWSSNATIAETWSGRLLVLPRPPLASVTSIVYADADGDSQTFSSANYTVATAYTPGYVQLKSGIDWPNTEEQNPAAVVVTYTAGYADAASVPQGIKNAVARLVALAYDQRKPLNDCDIPKEMYRHLDRFRNVAAS